ncbi:MAG: hypothetical protein SVO26_02565 [Chloroflexota bacterium]|nr:hypothetical protein [Chloroflexota bacterium]
MVMPLLRKQESSAVRIRINHAGLPSAPRRMKTSIIRTASVVSPSASFRTQGEREKVYLHNNDKKESESMSKEKPVEGII